MTLTIQYEAYKSLKSKMLQLPKSRSYREKLLTPKFKPR